MCGDGGADDVHVAAFAAISNTYAAAAHTEGAATVMMVL